MLKDKIKKNKTQVYSNTELKKLGIFKDTKKKINN